MRAGPALIGAAYLLGGGRFAEEAIVLATLAGSILGFAPLNWPPSRLMIGDGGSTAIASRLPRSCCCCSLTGACWPESASSPIAALEGTITLLRRLARRTFAIKDIAITITSGRAVALAALVVAAVAAAPGVLTAALLFIGLNDPLSRSGRPCHGNGACLVLNGGLRES